MSLLLIFYNFFDISVSNLGGSTEPPLDPPQGMTMLLLAKVLVWSWSNPQVTEHLKEATGKKDLNFFSHIIIGMQCV